MYVGKELVPKTGELDRRLAILVNAAEWLFSSLNFRY